MSKKEEGEKISTSVFSMGASSSYNKKGHCTRYKASVFLSTFMINFNADYQLLQYLKLSALNIMLIAEIQQKNPEPNQRNKLSSQSQALMKFFKVWIQGLKHVF